MDAALGAGELSAVDRFRQSRKTSVLTVMFTDIEGFTRFTEEAGDEASDRFRKLHDAAVVGAVEEGDAGQVIKHIGDAVMAVFAEPSAAVARALEVQRRISRLAAENPGLPPLRVRVGLHMGQVTVEDQVSPDVFGRHVNRASRVEGLAAGGQVFLTYPVFDSAKSWLLSQPRGEAAWAAHGRYRVKGIDEALEIFEAYDPRLGGPRPPEGVRRESSMPRLLPALGLAALGALAAFGLLRFKRTAVIFEDLGGTNPVVLDHGVTLVLEGESGQHLRRSRTPIPVGRHLLHRDVSYVTRYYAPIEVKRGENVIAPQFAYHGMPGFEHQVYFPDLKGKDASFHDAEEYAAYAPDGARLKRKVEAATAVAARRDGPGRLRWTVSWVLTLDGREAARESREWSRASGDAEDARWSKVVWQDERHYWTFAYRLSGESCFASAQAAYIEYKDK